MWLNFPGQHGFRPICAPGITGLAALLCGSRELRENWAEYDRGQHHLRPRPETQRQHRPG